MYTEVVWRMNVMKDMNLVMILFQIEIVKPMVHGLASKMFDSNNKSIFKGNEIFKIFNIYQVILPFAIWLFVEKPLLWNIVIIRLLHRSHMMKRPLIVANQDLKLMTKPQLR